MNRINLWALRFPCITLPQPSPKWTVCSRTLSDIQPASLRSIQKWKFWVYNSSSYCYECIHPEYLFPTIGCCWVECFRAYPDTPELLLLKEKKGMCLCCERLFSEYSLSLELRGILCGTQRCRQLSLSQCVHSSFHSLLKYREPPRCPL